MNRRFPVAALGLAAALTASLAAGADAHRGRASVPPGASQDGAQPGEGAIKGGSLEGRRATDSPIERRKEVERCRDLAGTLREQCLRDARSEPVVPPVPALPAK